jgi:hypothetical protein
MSSENWGQLLERSPFGTKPKMQKEQVVLSVKPVSSVLDTFRFCGAMVDSKGDFVCIFYNNATKKSLMVKKGDKLAGFFVEYDGESCARIKDSQGGIIKVLPLTPENNNQSGSNSQYAWSLPSVGNSGNYFPPFDEEDYGGDEMNGSEMVSPERWFSSEEDGGFFN